LPPLRPPLVPPDSPRFDPQRILEVLARHRVEWVVIGGYAAVLAGIDVVTRDIDITPPPTNPTSSFSPPRSASCMPQSVCQNEPIPLPADPRLLARTEILNLTTHVGDLDITTRPDGTGGYNDLKQGRTPKDLATLPQLRAARERQRKAAKQENTGA
jgi:hypothetical protein